MNKVILMGRLTRDPEVRYSQAAEPLAIARYTLAVDRRFKRDGDQTADFIGCVAFGKLGEFAEKYLRTPRLGYPPLYKGSYLFQRGASGNNFIPAVYYGDEGTRHLLFFYTERVQQRPVSAAVDAAHHRVAGQSFGLYNFIR